MEGSRGCGRGRRSEGLCSELGPGGTPALLCEQHRPVSPKGHRASCSKDSEDQERRERRQAGGWAQGKGQRGEVGAHSPQHHHVEGVVGDAGDERHEGDEEDGREQEVGTGAGARACLG